MATPNSSAAAARTIRRDREPADDSEVERLERKLQEEQARVRQLEQALRAAGRVLQPYLAGGPVATGERRCPCRDRPGRWPWPPRWSSRRCSPSMVVPFEFAKPKAIFFGFDLYQSTTGKLSTNDGG